MQLGRREGDRQEEGKRKREIKEEEEKKREREEETGRDVKEWLLGSHFYPVAWCDLGVKLRSSGLCTSDLLSYPTSLCP